MTDSTISARLPSDDADEPAWLTIGRELKAIAQIGLTFNRDPYDRARYERIRELPPR